MSGYIGKKEVYFAVAAARQLLELSNSPTQRARSLGTLWTLAALFPKECQLTEAEKEEINAIG